MKDSMPKNVSHASTKTQKHLEKHLFGVFLHSCAALKNDGKNNARKTEDQINRHECALECILTKKDKMTTHTLHREQAAVWFRIA